MLSKLEKPSLPDCLREHYSRVRQDSGDICQYLEIEDYGIQTMPDVSPPKWHLAHVSWFFETFILKPFAENFKEFHPQFAHLFNSYYETVGTFHPRPERGLLARPTVREVYQYRAHVDEAMQELLSNDNHPQRQEIANRTVLGLHHEQQHQELLYTDIKHALAYSPLRPVYHACDYPDVEQVAGYEWLELKEGLYEVGHAGQGFGYDNEFPRHKTWLQQARLANRLVTNGEFLEFMQDGGYQHAALWLSDGWKTVRQQNQQSPLYWQQQDGEWWYYTLSGYKPIDLNAPVCHVSLYEADAFARWAGKRLPREAEWEQVAARFPITGNLREQNYLQPIPAERNQPQFYGDVWEWTQSAYAPYPGYITPAGAIGEYNGKFMSSQFVLRGGSCVTPVEHIRGSYRNFFYPADRWQFSGIRLAE
ncbi:MAG: ergothioneine biosynthesis protein EgtB [Gammaproteobacteria bacterium]|nr:ergothioneine biosynthesis protein EgtB [Gammaproteobacteria bacterium]MDH5652280.1 ergothioneine biosynthesis protein EgtB [Gammaproteobacteria bacterium]